MMYIFPSRLRLACLAGVASAPELGVRGRRRQHQSLPDAAAPRKTRSAMDLHSMVLDESAEQV